MRIATPLKKQKSIVDVVFIIALLGVFTITAFFTLIFGSQIYSGIVNERDEKHFSRTAYHYITEKMHSHDEAGCVDIIDCGEGKALRLKTANEASEYYTYLYYEDGAVREFTAIANFDFNFTGGTKIFDAKNFFVEELGDGNYHFIIVHQKYGVIDFNVSLMAKEE